MLSFTLPESSKSKIPSVAKSALCRAERLFLNMAGSGLLVNYIFMTQLLTPISFRKSNPSLRLPFTLGVKLPVLTPSSITFSAMDGKPALMLDVPFSSGKLSPSRFFLSSCSFELWKLSSTSIGISIS